MRKRGWKKDIQFLLDTGMSRGDIISKCGFSGSSLNRFMSGKPPSPRLAVRLELLVKQVKERKEADGST